MAATLLHQRTERPASPTWTRASATGDIELDDLIRFDHGTQTFVIVRSEDDTFHARDGGCSHEKVHLCAGLVMEGTVGCPKHNATFNYRTSEAKRALACANRPRADRHVDRHAFRPDRTRHRCGQGGAVRKASRPEPRPRAGLPESRFRQGTPRDDRLQPPVRSELCRVEGRSGHGRDRQAGGSFGNGQSRPLSPSATGGNAGPAGNGPTLCWSDVALARPSPV